MSHLANPADRAFLVTKSDATDLTVAAGFPPRGLYIGGTGDVNVVMLNDVGTETTVLFSAVPVGAVLPIRVRKVMSTSTTATLIVALG